MAALISSVMSTKDRVPYYVSRVRTNGARGAAAGRQLEPVRLRRGRRQDPLRPDCGQAGGGGRGARDHRRPRGAPFTSIWDFCERVDAGVLNRGMLESLVACGALDSTGATRKGMFEVLEQALGSGQKQQADAHDGPPLDLRPGRRGRRRRPGRRPLAPGDRHRSSGTATSCSAARRRRSASTSPATRCRRSASSSTAARPAAVRPGVAPRRAGRDRRRPGHQPQALRDPQGRPDGVRRAGRRHRQRRGRGVRQHLGGHAVGAARRGRPGQGPGRPEGRGRDQDRGPRGGAVRGRPPTSGSCSSGWTPGAAPAR